MNGNTLKNPSAGNNVPMNSSATANGVRVFVRNRQNQARATNTPSGKRYCHQTA